MALAVAVAGGFHPSSSNASCAKNFETLRGCYEGGLGRNSELTGRVTVRFVIGRDGKVSNAADGGSNITDAEVQRCVVQAIGGLEFPPPLNGVVSVVYPNMFAPG
jgi:hypothetical protein